MRITMQTTAYNERRYGRPWIAVVSSWPIGGRPELRWGRWNGRDGQPGVLEVEAASGDIIRSGQKDHRGNLTDNDWAILDGNGNLRSVTAAEAREVWVASRAQVA